MKKAIFLIFCSAVTIGTLIFWNHSLNSKPILVPETTSTSTNESPHHKKLKLIDLENADENRLMKTVINACPKIISSVGTGTGFLFGDTGLVITALHVVNKDDWVYVQFYTLTDDYNELEENIIMPGTVVGWSNADYDLAFIHIDTIPKGVTPLKAAPNKNFANEQPVWRFGYNAHYKWAQGIYSPENCPEFRCLVTMPADRGGSGGPFVDGQGRVMGVFQRFNDSDDDMITDKDFNRILEFQPAVAHFLPLPYITTWILSQNLQ